MNSSAAIQQSMPAKDSHKSDERPKPYPLELSGTAPPLSCSRAISQRVQCPHHIVSAGCRLLWFSRHPTQSFLHSSFVPAKIRVGVHMGRVLVVTCNKSYLQIPDGSFRRAPSMTISGIHHDVLIWCFPITESTLRFQPMLTRAEVLSLSWLTLSTGMGRYFSAHFLPLPFLPHSVSGQQRQEGGGAEGEQGEGHVAAHCPREPFPPCYLELD